MSVSDVGSKVILLNYTKALPKEHLCVHIKTIGLRGSDETTRVTLVFFARKSWIKALWIQSRIRNTLTTYTRTFILTFATTTVQTTNSDLEVRHFPAD